MKILLSSAKHLLTLKDVPKAALNFCSGFLSCYWSILSSVYPVLDAGKIGENPHFIGDFLNNFQDHRRLSEQFLEQ